MVRRARVVEFLAQAQLAGRRPRPQVVEATGLPHVVDATGLPHVVDATGLPHVVEATGLLHVVDATGLPQVVEARAGVGRDSETVCMGISPLRTRLGEAGRHSGGPGELQSQFSSQHERSCNAPAAPIATINLYDT